MLPELTAIGNFPKYFQAPKDILGCGSSKVVRLAIALKNSLGGFSGKTHLKEVAESRQSCASIGQQVEQRVFSILAKDPVSCNFTPKIYFVGQNGSDMVTVTKAILNGDSRNCLPYMSVGERLSTIEWYGKSLQYLHSKNIIHNDTALRNMLVEWPTEKRSPKEALNCMLARPIYAPNGNTIFKLGELITDEIKELLEFLKISEVKVFSKQHPKGLITDFGHCTILGDMTSDGCAIDCTSPEKIVASRLYKKLRVGGNASKEVLDAAQESFLRASTVQSDLFSFGQLLCDAILRPGLNTHFSEDNEYNSLCNDRINRRIKKYEEKTETSAISPRDYTELFRIDPNLANLASNLMNYQPDLRPSLDEALLILDHVIAKFPAKNSPQECYHAHYFNAARTSLSHSNGYEYD